MKKIFDYPGPLWRVNSAVATLLVCLSVLVYGSRCIVGVLFGASDAFVTRTARGWCAFVLRVYRIEVECLGEKPPNDGQPLLVLSNHQSLMDIPAVFVSVPGKLRMMAKAELFRIPVFGLALKLAGFIPVQRDRDQNRKVAAQGVADKLRKGFRIWVAPEGTRNPSKKLLPFRSGSLGMAIQESLAVWPLLLVNSDELVDKGSLWIKTGKRLRICSMPMVETAGMLVEGRHELAERIQKSMQERMDEQVGLMNEQARLGGAERL